MSRRITKKQLISLYWPRWRAAEKVLRHQGGHSKEDAEEARKEIHLQVLGHECSSKDIPGNRLDDILRRFAAIATPRDGRRQADHAEQPLVRIRFKIAGIQKRLDLPDHYIEAMAVRIAKRPLGHCDEAGLKKVLAALVIHERRQATPNP